jgi:hypothetical protein
MEALSFRLIGYVAGRVVMEPRISAAPGPVAEKPCCGAVRFLNYHQVWRCRGFTSTRATFRWTATIALVFYRLRPVSADLTSSR